MLDWARNAVNIYPTRQTQSTVVPVSINYFPHRQCNYACKFCFHTTKNLDILPLEDAKRGLRMCAYAGMKKLNISGGEPFLKPHFIGEIFKFCKEELRIEACSVVNNGSKVTESWLDEYGKYLDVMAISCDSFDPEINIELGRSAKNEGNHIGCVFRVAEWCRLRGIKVKINSVINSLNWEEDMNSSIAEIAPFRWKVFQVLLLDTENTGKETGSLRDARDLVISKDKFQAFLDKHKEQLSLVPEDNESMRNSYLSLDEKMRFLDCSEGGKKPGRSILEVGVQEGLMHAGFDEEAFMDRGGVFEWTRSPEDETRASEW